MPKSKKIKIISAILVFTLTIGLFAGMSMNARAEVLLEESNPQFEYFVNYAGDPMSDGGWVPDPELCKLTYDEESENYTFTSNAYVMWGPEDNISYAYNLYRLNNGDLGKIKITTKILEHTTMDSAQTNEMHDNASIGISIRSTTETNGTYASKDNAKEIYLHVRSNCVMVVYRTAEGARTVRIAGQKDITAWPIYLTMEKEGNAVSCSVKMGDDGIQQNFAKVYIGFSEIVTAGMASHSVDENVPVTSVFSDYNLSISGPDGSVYEPVYGESEGGSDTEENLDDVIPNDPPMSEEILFRETFTDGSLVNENADGRETADNPLWSNKYSINGAAEMANIVTEGDNRYWKRSGTSDTYIFPNLEWSDYSMEIDLKFGENANLQQNNAVDIYVRLNASQAEGYFGYRIAMENTYNESQNISVQSVSLYKLCSQDSLNGVINNRLCGSVDYNYIISEWVTWRIEAFDNHISVYCGEELVLEFTEEPGEEIYGYAVNGRGGIGFGSENAELMVDNIIVRKMEDLMGGNFDNRIGGRWDQPIPDYIMDYSYEIE